MKCHKTQVRAVRADLACSVCQSAPERPSYPETGERERGMQAEIQSLGEGCAGGK